MTTYTDAELLALLADTDPADLENVIASLPAESIAPLLGMIGAGAEVDMPKTPADQAKEIDADYRIRPHIEYLSNKLAEAVADIERGISRKIIVSMPPRHGKTELASVYLPLWLLRRNHKTKIGIISHSPNLAAAWGRRVRRMVERYGADLGLSIASDAGAVSEWETPEGGGVMSRSIGQALAGVGFNVLIVDDPVRDFAAAHSEPTRQSVWDWWTANAVTRLEPPSLVVVIATRWHEDDLIGRLLSAEHEGDPDEWETITLPALADHDPDKGESDPLGRAPGDPLYSPLLASETRDEALQRFTGLRRDVGSYAWSALYMQKPSPSKGAIFDISWWRFWTSSPAGATEDGRVRYLDPASLEGRRVIDSWDATFKDSKDSDFVVGQRWARVNANRFLLWQVRARMSFTKTLATMKAWAKPDDSSPFARHVHTRLVEDKANGPAILDALKDEVSGLKPVNPRGSKEARARAVTPEIESGNVILPDPTMPGYEWVNGLIAETRAFPTGEHDDQVDAMTQALDELRETGRAQLTVPGRAPAASASTRAAAPPNVARRTVTINRTAGARGDLARRRG